MSLKVNIWYDHLYSSTQSYRAGLGADPGPAGETISLVCLGIDSTATRKGLEELAGEREMWGSLLRLLPP